MPSHLRQIKDDDLYAMAIVMNLHQHRLKDAGRHTAKPSSRWMNEQQSRIPGLPRCLQAPQIPHLSVKASQMAKRLIIAASGGAAHVAAKAAEQGINIDAVLHPSHTPTVLCRAHRGLHPDVVREIFLFLTREVCDHADWVRRHPMHDEAGGDDADSITVCNSQDVQDWGLRMIGISALWCDRHTFRALEKGRQSSGKSHKGKGKSKSSTKSSMKSSSSSSKPHAAHIPSSMRFPHLASPCEACIIAAVGSRAQSLIDLRASLLSRIAEDQEEKRRRDIKRGRRPKEPKPDPRTGQMRLAYPTPYPNLYSVIEVYIAVFGNEHGADAAHEIRERSTELGEKLYQVRHCDNHRRRHTKEKEKRLPRMVTQNGHRLPLPLLPPDADLLQHYEESVVGEQYATQEQLEARYYEEVEEDGFEGDSRDYDCLYFVIGDNESEDEHDEHEEEEEMEEDVEEVERQSQKPPPSMVGSDYLAHLGYDDYFNRRTSSNVQGARSTVNKPTPDWEEDYRRNVLDSQTVISSAVGGNSRENDDDEGSYVSVSVYTQTPATTVGPASRAGSRVGSTYRAGSRAGARTGPSRPSAPPPPVPPVPRILSTIPGTSISSTMASAANRTSAASVVSAVSALSSRPPSSRSVMSFSQHLSQRSSQFSIPPRPSCPTPTQPREYPPAPASSVYSRTTTATQLRQREKETKTKTASVYSNVSGDSQVSGVSSASRAPRSSVSSVRSSVSRSPSQTSQVSQVSQTSRSSSRAPAASTPSRTPLADRTLRTPRVASTTFIPPPTVRTPASAGSYVALQANMDVSYINASSSTVGRARPSPAMPTLTSSRSRTPITPSTPMTSTSRTTSTSRSASTPRSTPRSATSTVSKSTVPSTAPAASTSASGSSAISGLSRFSQPQTSSPYKLPSMAQKSAVPTGLFERLTKSTKSAMAKTAKPAKAASVVSAPSAASVPSVRAAQAATRSSVNSTATSATAWPKPMADAPFTAPVPAKPVHKFVKTLRTTAPAPRSPAPAPAPPAAPAAPRSQSQPAPLTKADAISNWIPRAPSKLFPSAGARLVEDVYEENFEELAKCTVLPDDSISVIVLEQAKAEARALAKAQVLAGARQRLPSASRQPLSSRSREVPATPTPAGRGQNPPAARNLNHYQPANSRRPNVQPPAVSRSVPPPQMRIPMTPRSQAQAQIQNKPLPKTPTDTKQQRQSTPRSSVRPPSTPTRIRPDSQSTQCTKWPGPAVY